MKAVSPPVATRASSTTARLRNAITRASGGAGSDSEDDEVDEHYNSLFRELLTYMMGDPRTITACAHMLFVAKNLERIGDHATNIAEIVHYEVTGEEMINARPKTDGLSA